MRETLETLALSEDSSDVTAALRELSDSNDVQRSLVAIAREAAGQQSVLRVARHLAAHGFDLDSIPLHRSVIAQARIPIFIPGIRETDEPVTLSALRDALLAHRTLLLDNLDRLGRLEPGRFAVVYGLALTLARPDIEDRQSSDIDIFVTSDGDPTSVRKSLIDELGFEFAGESVGHGAGSDLMSWKLSKRDGDHAVLLDVYVDGRPSAGHQWIPPFRLPTLFSDGRQVTLAGGGVTVVPSPEHMLVMLAEKVQRKGDFALRRVGDALALVRPELDWDLVQRWTRETHVGLGLQWLLAEVASRHPDRVPAEVTTAVALPAWEARIQLAMRTGSSPETRQRARSLYRRLWVGRYVRGHRTKWPAAVEVGAGRLVKMKRTGFHYEGPGRKRRPRSP